MFSVQEYNRLDKLRLDIEQQIKEKGVKDAANEFNRPVRINMRSARVPAQMQKIAVLHPDLNQKYSIKIK